MGLTIEKKGFPMANSTSKSSSPTKKEQQLQSDREIKRILRDDGMRKPIILEVPNDGPNCYSLKVDGENIGPGNSIVVDVPTNSIYKLR